MKNISLVQKSRPLDPVLLGRPVQVFEALAILLARCVAEQLQLTGHRSLDLTIQDAHFSPAKQAGPTEIANLDIGLARHTVQALMAQRYGFDSQPGDLSDNTTVSATELRITRSLHDAIANAVKLTLPAATPHATTQAWQWQAQIQVGLLPPQMLHIGLTAAASAGLEQCVAQQRQPLRATPPSSEPLMVELQALLVQKTITAADMQQLRVGSVLPIALDRAKVALNGQVMLSASVAEHQGNLHLTAFENLE